MTVLSLPQVSIVGSPLRSLALALFLTWCLRTVSYLRRVRSFPPGPPKHLLLDNRGDMAFPIAETYKSFKSWHEQYGKGIVSFFLGRKIVICECDIGPEYEELTFYRFQLWEPSKLRRICWKRKEAFIRAGPRRMSLAIF